MPFFSKYKFGYLPSTEIEQKTQKINDWVSIAEQFIDTPYKWGGRSAFGLDCSALVQISLQISLNIYFPRNTSDQIFYAMKIGKKVNKIERGTLIFWKGHIALACDKVSIIHANAYHMKTKKELFKDAKKRLSSECGEIITMIKIHA